MHLDSLVAHQGSIELFLCVQGIQDFLSISLLHVGFMEGVGNNFKKILAFPKQSYFYSFILFLFLQSLAFSCVWFSAFAVSTPNMHILHFDLTLPCMMLLLSPAKSRTFLFLQSLWLSP